MCPRSDSQPQLRPGSKSQPGSCRPHVTGSQFPGLRVGEKGEEESQGPYSLQHLNSEDGVSPTHVRTKAAACRSGLCRTENQGPYRWVCCDNSRTEPRTITQPRDNAKIINSPVYVHSLVIKEIQVHLKALLILGLHLSTSVVLIHSYQRTAATLWGPEELPGH